MLSLQSLSTLIFPASRLHHRKEGLLSHWCALEESERPGEEGSKGPGLGCRGVVPKEGEVSLFQLLTKSPSTVGCDSRPPRGATKLLLVQTVSFTTSWATYRSSAFCWDRVVGKLLKGVQLAAGQRKQHVRTDERERCSFTRSCENMARCGYTGGRVLWNG